MRVARKLCSDLVRAGCCCCAEIPFVCPEGQSSGVVDHAWMTACTVLLLTDEVVCKNKIFLHFLQELCTYWKLAPSRISSSPFIYIHLLITPSTSYPFIIHYVKLEMNILS